ncbi:calcium/sodium antiporter [bacterium]|nr:calcium/sodium antiporter [bacterium]
MTEHLLYLAAGIVLLYFGAEGLVRGGSGLALRFGIAPLVVGLTVVAFGTSSPELVVSVQAALDGKGAISIGNVVGSNIGNIALILGVASLIYPLEAQIQIIRSEIPVMIGVTVLLCVLLLDGILGKADGAILFCGILIYTGYTVYEAKKQTKGTENYETELSKNKKNVWLQIFLTVFGLALLIFGSDLFVKGAVSIAKNFGLSDAVIGLTIVAIGTSLPELATSVLASIKKESEIAIGNVVGSNIFNILGILGIAALIQPIDASEISKIDTAVMIFTAVLLFPLIKTGMKLVRLEGFFLLVGYAIYIFYLINQAA